MNKTDYTELYQALGYTFQQESLLINALTHRSYLNESQYEKLEHNERLEFLGDAVLELVTTEHLFKQYPTYTEGDLTSFRAAMVRTESLAETATGLCFGDYIFMSKGEESTGGRSRPYILANTFESILGAVYLDSGLESCRVVVGKHLLPKLEKIVSLRLDIDAKSHFQELAQERYKVTPTYSIVDEEGPDHDRTFTSKVLIGEKEFGIGKGKSKQEAEQMAAKSGLSLLQGENRPE